MSYRFQHIVKDLHGEEIMEVVVNLSQDGLTTDELVTNFVYFLEGCGFVRGSILRALEAQAEELDFKDD